MEVFFRAATVVLLTVIMVLCLGSHGKQTAILLVLAVCAMLGVLVMSYLEPVVDFVRRLQTLGKLDSGMLRILLKVVGIGLVGEIANLICCDTGNAALGKMLQILSTAVILRLSVPLLEQLLGLLEQIMREV
jgi:stage III sporulation protein AD